MSDKAKASEHDLREGSKPRCPKCGRIDLSVMFTFSGIDVDCNCGFGQCCSQLADFAQFFPIAAILEENQRLQRAFCEAHAAEDCKTCPCCEAVHQDDLRKAAEAENQRLAKELADSDKEDDENYAGYLREVKAREAAEAKLGKMLEALRKIQEMSQSFSGSPIEAGCLLGKIAGMACIASRDE